MRTINFNINNKNNKKVNKNLKNNEKIILTYHGCIEEVPEYYTYIDNDTEVKFTDSSYMINKISSSKYIAKKNIVNKIPLKKNTYIGIIENSVLDYTKVVLFEE